MCIWVRLWWGTSVNLVKWSQIISKSPLSVESKDDALDLASQKIQLPVESCLKCRLSLSASPHITTHTHTHISLSAWQSLLLPSMSEYGSHQDSVCSQTQFAAISCFFPPFFMDSIAVPERKKGKRREKAFRSDDKSGRWGKPLRGVYKTAASSHVPVIPFLFLHIKSAHQTWADSAADHCGACWVTERTTQDTRRDLKDTAVLFATKIKREKMQRGRGA